MQDGEYYKRFGENLLNFCFNFCTNDKKFQTTKEEWQEKINEQDNYSRCENRIGWAVSYLKQAECIEKTDEKFHYKITQLGLEILKKFQDVQRITLKDLKNDTPFLQNEKSNNHDKNDEINEKVDQIAYDDLKDIIANIKKDTKQQFIEYVRSMSWQEFEDFCVDLVVKMGYGTGRKNNVKHRDGGIDGIVYSDILQLDQIYIQAKRYSDAKVSRRDMTDFIHNTRKSGRGIFLTTSDFSA